MAPAINKWSVRNEIAEPVQMNRDLAGDRYRAIKWPVGQGRIREEIGKPSVRRDRPIYRGRFQGRRYHLFSWHSVKASVFPDASRQFVWKRVMIAMRYRQRGTRSSPAKFRRNFSRGVYAGQRSPSSARKREENCAEDAGV